VLYKSEFKELDSVPFPDTTGERVYMEPFLQREGLPPQLMHWQRTVDAMLGAYQTSMPIYLMIDQSDVKEGEAHRRPGVHIDGYWNPAVEAHSNGPGHGAQPAPVHTPRPTHSCGSGSWAAADFAELEAVILASSMEGAVGYLGEYAGPIGDMGDCSHLDTSQMDKFLMRAGRAYGGNITGLHESVPVKQNGHRTLVRLNVPKLSLN